MDADIRVMIGVVQEGIYKKLLFLCRLFELTTECVVFMLYVHKFTGSFITKNHIRRKSPLKTRLGKDNILLSSFKMSEF